MDSKKRLCEFYFEEIWYLTKLSSPILWNILNWDKEVPLWATKSGENNIYVFTIFFPVLGLGLQRILDRVAHLFFKDFLIHCLKLSRNFTVH